MKFLSGVLAGALAVRYGRTAVAAAHAFLSPAEEHVTLGLCNGDEFAPGPGEEAGRRFGFS